MHKIYCFIISKIYWTISFLGLAISIKLFLDLYHNALGICWSIFLLFFGTLILLSSVIINPITSKILSKKHQATVEKYKDEITESITNISPYI